MTAMSAMTAMTAVSEFLLSYYGELRLVHITAALVSGAGFVLRGVWMLSDSPRLSQRWVRRLPHAVDTLLLLSALALVFASGQYPGDLPWLNAKIAALLAYIGCGMFALRRGRKSDRVFFFVLALTCYAYILTTARTRDPHGLLTLLGL